MTANKSTTAYEARAPRYDEFAAVTMGDRKRQRHYLEDLLRKHRFMHDTFLELGCGTGYFSEVFFQRRPDISGHLVDGSAEMLELCRQRLSDSVRKARFQHCRFEACDWSVEKAFDVVFSAYAIHHVADEEKWKLFAKIKEQLCPSGMFILFDNFLPREPRSREVIEFLTCMDIKRRGHLVATSIEQIIETDREKKEAEGDQEATFEEHLQQLRNIGFHDVTPVFLEARYGGIIAYKP